MEKQVLIADEGMIYTNGEIFGKWISLAVNKDPDEFYQITEDEYQTIIENQEQEDELTAEEALEIITGGSA